MIFEILLLTLIAVDVVLQAKKLSESRRFIRSMDDMDATENPGSIASLRIRTTAAYDKAVEIHSMGLLTKIVANETKAEVQRMRQELNEYLGGIRAEIREFRAAHSELMLSMAKVVSENRDMANDIYAQAIKSDAVICGDLERIEAAVKKPKSRSRR